MNRIANRRGLTLLELVVVMVILVALASILVPMLPGMLGRAHVAEHSTNVIELNKAWELYNVTNRAYPDYLDSLVDRGGTDVYNKIPGLAVSGLFTVTSVSDLATAVGGGLTSAQLVDRLSAIGLRNVYSMDNATPNATFEPYGAGVTTPVAMPVAATTNLVRLSTAEVVQKLNGAADGVYVVLGVGAKCGIVGQGIVSAPVHFSEAAGEAGNPMNTYARFGVIYNLKPQTPKFVGVVAFHDDGISTVDDAIQEYYRQSR
jgi:prepilin-type N-terminal cleavage/methylation domain-containing protein